MFYFLLVIFVVVLGAVLYTVFWVKKDALTSGGLVLLDGLIGWSLKYMVTYLFPSDNQHWLKKITRKFISSDESSKDQ